MIVARVKSLARKSFRDFVGDLEAAGELRRVGKDVDPRQISGLLAISPEALLLESITGYPDWRLTGSLVSTRKRLAIAMDCPENAVALRFEEALGQPIEPEFVNEGACQEVVHAGDEVDLTAIPYPLMHLLDGGPYISATFVVSKDPEYGPNVGSYRMMYRTPRETSIDLVSPSDMRFYYQRMLDQGKPLEIAVAIGVHPCDMLAASFKAPIRNSEFAIAGGLHGAPVPLVKCKTVDLEVPGRRRACAGRRAPAHRLDGGRGAVRRVQSGYGRTSRRQMEPHIPREVHHPQARSDLLSFADAVGKVTG